MGFCINKLTGRLTLFKHFCDFDGCLYCLSFFKGYCDCIEIEIFIIALEKIFLFISWTKLCYSGFFDWIFLCDIQNEGEA